MDNNLYIYIFSYSTASIFEITTTQEELSKYGSPEKLMLKKYELNDSDINYMITDEKLKITSLEQ